ncbi:MAG: hypothetical protein A2927_00825 [Candidatus Komeilibacteria bacterium RIFCSPLOWO2_01_FULL_45_10]|uniref:Uncharacterized protein n=1 Tax=Candidatus Komeilibacteria bacterium RIFCSPLOWO2_01_FULL_45_10 TaxID=1798550 RepID=A0A1G2BMH4_9BACT|nr:MAG: hypothetical protein A2927_00825 [Candidatus Komeilibacteria bacterium RIFCSPLOWO2_01_FULL_45_10]
MPRKATNFETMSIETLEQLFTAVRQDIDQLRDQLREEIKNSINQLREEMADGFKKQNEILKTILNIVGFYDTERKDIKSSLWEHDRRLLKLEKQSV